MPQASVATQNASPRPARRSVRPFRGLLESVIVDEPILFEFDGAIPCSHAAAAWTWMRRDLAPDLGEDVELGEEADAGARTALEARMPDLLARARSAVDAADEQVDARHRLMAQLGGEEALHYLPVVLNALKGRALLAKAQTFGRATNSMTDEAALGAALQSMPLSNPAVAALLFQAAIGQVANPGRLVVAAIRASGAATETAIVRAGFAPLLDAIFSHAQNQIPVVTQSGPFADIDLICRAVSRFHRLVRAINNFVEPVRSGRWAMINGALVKSMSDSIEPRMRDVVMDVNKALRRHRDGADRLDSNQLLSALNGVYLLATVRDCRDSLAVNALFDQTWSQIGEVLEVHLQRNLDAFRSNPRDTIASERLSAAIKMAELRYTAEYADVLRRAKEAAERR